MATLVWPGRLTHVTMNHMPPCINFCPVHTHTTAVLDTAYYVHARPSNVAHAAAHSNMPQWFVCMYVCTSSHSGEPNNPNWKGCRGSRNSRNDPGTHLTTIEATDWPPAMYVTDRVCRWSTEEMGPVGRSGQGLGSSRRVKTGVKRHTAGVKGGSKLVLTLLSCQRPTLILKPPSQSK